MYLTEMAYNRNKAIDYVRDTMQDIQEHLIKCVIYSDMNGAVSHWINTELTSDIYDVATIKIKTPNGKLTEEDYVQIFSEFFDDDEEDARRHLMSFYRKNRRSKEYPVKLPTEENAQRLFSIYTYFNNIFAKRFSEKEISKEWINQTLWEILT